MADVRDSEPPESSDVSHQVPGDWPDVKRYLIRLMGLVLIGVLMMFGTAIYYYVHYHGARAETTHVIPGYADKAR
jgi:hypothetical protein